MEPGFKVLDVFGVGTFAGANGVAFGLKSHA